MNTPHIDNAMLTNELLQKFADGRVQLLIVALILGAMFKSGPTER
jgi:hypothetical protein